MTAHLNTKVHLRIHKNSQMELYLTQRKSVHNVSLCFFKYSFIQWRTEGGGGLGVQTPPSEIPKALQNRAKLNSILKTVKNC